VISLPAAALLIGSGAHTLTQIRGRRPSPLLIAAMLALVPAVIWASLGGWKVLLPSFLLAIGAVPVLSRLGPRFDPGGRFLEMPTTPSLRPAFLAVLTFCLAATFLAESRLLHSQLRPSGQPGFHECAKCFSRLIPTEGLIVASGGTCRDAKGYPVAYNAPYFFYWLDRKGFNVCHEDQSLSTVRALTLKGARYFIAERRALRAQPGFEAELRATLPLIDQCEDALLFRLEA
jgi:hypothetical protein